MKKIGAIIASFALAFSLAGCSNSETSSVGNFAPSLIEDNSNADSSSETSSENAPAEPSKPQNTPPPEQPVLMEITITAGDTVLDGVLFDNYTARCFADMLPLTSELWNPADSYAKAFDLPSEIPDEDERTRNYELGSLAYWFEGPSVAIIHNDNREQTVVPVVPIGKITSDVGIFFNYVDDRESVTIEKKGE